jgi:hypothetical protein
LEPHAPQKGSHPSHRLRPAISISSKTSSTMRLSGPAWFCCFLQLEPSVFGGLRNGTSTEAGPIANSRAGRMGTHAADGLVKTGRNGAIRHLRPTGCAVLGQESSGGKELKQQLSNSQICCQRNGISGTLLRISEGHPEGLLRTPILRRSRRRCSRHRSSKLSQFEQPQFVEQ